LQKSFEEGSCATLATLESKEDLHISFTLVRGTEHDNTSYFDSGTSYDPRLEDADIQFHASFVLSFNVFTGLGGHMKNYYGTDFLCSFAAFCRNFLNAAAQSVDRANFH